jgi:hypothetical protein
MSESDPRRWTADRQLRFLDALAQTRSITRAATAAGMSRKSAYRLRARNELLAALWDRCIEPATVQGHNPALGDGGLMRLLGNHFRRDRGDFANVGPAAANIDRTRPL